MYEKMMYAIKKNDADICECQFEKTAGIVKSNKEQQTDKVTILKKEEALKAVVEEKINPVVWNKIYKREIVDQLYFEKGKYNEDEFWIGFNRKNDKIDFHFTSYEGMCGYKFNEFYNVNEIENKFDMLVQVNAIKYLNMLIDEEILGLPKNVKK